MTFAYRTWQRAVRRGTKKLIEYAVDGARYTQLFDVAADPLEMNNLAAAEPLPMETAATLAELRQLLADQLAAYDDPYRDAFAGEGKAVAHAAVAGW
jgi:arylsulfatase A-like enzyme